MNAEKLDTVYIVRFNEIKLCKYSFNKEAMYFRRI